MKKYIYPKFDAAKNLHVVRVGGCGLANCLFTYAKAISLAHRDNLKLITPAWFNLSIGPYVRHQSDKRHYIGLMSADNEVKGIYKCYKLLFSKNEIEVVSGLGNYFQDILHDAEYVSNYIVSHINKKIRQNVDRYIFKDSVAIHVRLGDYNDQQRIPLSWYVEKIKQKKNDGFENFLLFSDGTDEELRLLTDIKGVKRVFFGNAIADIYAMSKCSYIIGSDSTFSGWAAFLGQVPCCFQRKHFGPVLHDKSNEIVEN